MHKLRFTLFGGTTRFRSVSLAPRNQVISMAQVVNFSHTRAHLWAINKDDKTPSSPFQDTTKPKVTPKSDKSVLATTFDQLFKKYEKDMIVPKIDSKILPPDPKQQTPQSNKQGENLSSRQMSTKQDGKHISTSQDDRQMADPSDTMREPQKQFVGLLKDVLSAKNSARAPMGYRGAPKEPIQFARNTAAHSARAPIGRGHQLREEEANEQEDQLGYEVEEQEGQLGYEAEEHVEDEDGRYFEERQEDNEYWEEEQEYEPMYYSFSPEQLQLLEPEQRPVNEQISRHVRIIRVISQSGENLGEMSREEAMEMAAQNELDLMLVKEDDDHAVCRLLNYEDYLHKKLADLIEQQHQRMKQERQLKPKLVKIRHTIQSHDKEVKMRQIEGFLDADKRVHICYYADAIPAAKQGLQSLVDKFTAEKGSDIVAENPISTTLQYAQVILKQKPKPKKKNK